MASYLQDLALGLRQAAGVLNPQIQRDTFEADEKDRARAEQRAFESQRMRQQFELQQATPQAQMARQQLENEQGFRRAVAEAGGDETKIAEAALQFGKPDLTMRILETKQKRLADTQARRDALQQRADEMDRRAEDRALDRTSRETIAREGLALRGEIARMTNVIAQGNLELRRLGQRGDAGTLTDDTLRMDAFRYLTDGTLPTNMGRGIQGADQATKIRNEAARIAKEELQMPVEEVREMQLVNKAGVAALSQLGRARAQILQFERLANYNADLALKASEETTRTGVPLLNRGVQWAQENLAGDPTLRKFTIANETFISEYAKVMGGGYGAAASTEGAQSRAHSLLNRATTQEEYRVAIKQLKAEMDNRVKSLNDQFGVERQRLKLPRGSSTSGGATVVNW